MSWFQRLNDKQVSRVIPIDYKPAKLSVDWDGQKIKVEGTEVVINKIESELQKIMTTSLVVATDSEASYKLLHDLIGNDKAASASAIEQFMHDEVKHTESKWWGPDTFDSVAVFRFDESISYKGILIVSIPEVVKVTPNHLDAKLRIFKTPAWMAGGYPEFSQIDAMTLILHLLMPGIAPFL